jgi:small conductance mechanosensitive channel
MINFTQLIDFFKIGLNRFILIMIIIVITIVIERILKKLMDKLFQRKTKLLKADPTHFVVLKHFISALIYMMGIAISIYSIPSLRSFSVSILAGAGVLGIIIGFASQAALSNVISGIFIAMFKPFRVGDRIKFGEKMGVVEDINLRHTIIRNFENKRFVVPNSIIGNEIIENFDIGDQKICRWVEFGISYDSDIDKAMKIMREEAMKHPEFIDNRTKQEREEGIPPVIVRVLGFGDSSVNLRAWVWAKEPGAAFRLGTDLNKTIKQRFDKEGIEIPFPYRTVVYKKDIKNLKKKLSEKNSKKQ